MAIANLKLAPGADMDSEITTQILKIVTRKKVCHLDDLVEKCQDYTWNQVFLEVDRLSRIGGLRLLYQKDGDYAVSLPPAA
jgi:hypothetical protein